MAPDTGCVSNTGRTPQEDEGKAKGAAGQWFCMEAGPSSPGRGTIERLERNDEEREKRKGKAESDSHH